MFVPRTPRFSSSASPSAPARPTGTTIAEYLNVRRIDGQNSASSKKAFS
jgi:hypothetical protein